MATTNIETTIAGFSNSISEFDNHFDPYKEAVPLPPWKPRIRHKNKINPKPRYAWLRFKPIVGGYLPFISNPYINGTFIWRLSVLCR